MGSNRIIIAIDFGTTFTGVGWADPSNPEHRGTIENWPLSKKAQEGMYAEKVPTVLRYTGSEGFEWGSQVSEEAPEEQVLKFFKLDLDPSIQFRGQEAVLGDRPRSKDPQTLVSDYLRGLGEHIANHMSMCIDAKFLEGHDPEFVLTVPAVWTELATQRTIDACRQAGGLFSNATIHVVSEPEAAASKLSPVKPLEISDYETFLGRGRREKPSERTLAAEVEWYRHSLLTFYCLVYTIASLPSKSMKEGDSFVICDAGGGTVDLISYTITKIHPVLELKEATVGEGAFCGSIFLNRHFEAFFKNKLTKLTGETGLNEVLVKEALTQFEQRVKRRFTSASENFVFKFSADSVAPSEIKRLGRLVVTAAEIQGVFEPVVSEIIKLVKDQIEASGVAIQKVFLVGGFGSSTHLRERLQGALEDTQVIHPANSLLAVVNGAIMKGLELSDPERLTKIKVRERVARKHMGTELGATYRPHKHAAYDSKKYWSGYSGKWLVDEMKWFIEKGDTVSEEKPFFQNIFGYRLVSDGYPRKSEVTIYNDDVGRPAPLGRDDLVQELCKVKLDLSHFSEHDFERKTGADGLAYYVYHYKLEWVYHSTTATFTLIHKNKRHDTVTVEYV